MVIGIPHNSAWQLNTEFCQETSEPSLLLVLAVCGHNFGPFKYQMSNSSLKWILKSTDTYVLLLGAAVENTIWKELR